MWQSTQKSERMFHYRPYTLLPRLSPSSAGVWAGGMGSQSVTTVEMIIRRAVNRIQQNSRSTISAAAMAEQLNLENTSGEQQVDRVSMVYKVRRGLVDMHQPLGLFKGPFRKTRGRQKRFRLPHSRTNTYLQAFFPSECRNHFPYTPPKPILFIYYKVLKYYYRWGAVTTSVNVKQCSLTFCTCLIF